jgi:hypothetical protein
VRWPPIAIVYTVARNIFCNSIIIAAFPDEDLGVQQAVQTFFGFKDDVIQAALGGDDSAMASNWTSSRG